MKTPYEYYSHLLFKMDYFIYKFNDFKWKMLNLDLGLCRFIFCGFLVYI